MDVCEKKTEESHKLQRHREKEDAEIVPYTEPEWSSTPPPNYKFEVIKGGKVISDISVSKSYVLFGRLQTCDVALEHPSVSRYHAVLQYCPGDGTRHKGFYVYDLGSTHGTFLNKKRITAKVYYKMDIGHILKFGGSSRLHIFQGPEEEQGCEEEPDKHEEEACNWGMGEDADEEEDLTVNPFALSTANEELYLDDPKKTLRGWFEREGYELEYDIEEKGFRTFVCKVHLPIDTPTGEYPVAEASVTGKKKEAVVACALEACRVLDRHGVLRQAHHENRRKKRKNWEDEDFYDSDEDTYLDRTGTIEKKREVRKKLVKKAEVETFQSLTSKLESIKAEISEIERKIQNSSSNINSQSDDDRDSLESYMSQIEGSVVIDKIMKSRLRLQMAELCKERTRLEKLLDIARPTPLPAVAKTFGIIGKRPTKKFQLPTVTKTYEVQKNNTEEIEEEEDSDGEDESSVVKTEPPVQEIQKSNGDSLPKGEVTTDLCDSLPKSEVPTDFCSESDEKSVVAKNLPCTSVTNASSPQKGTEALPTTSAQVKRTRPAGKVDVYKSYDSDYSMWVPPVDQTGDGTTHLNAKYGY